MNKLSRYFLQGILYITPIAITAYVIFLIATSLDNLLQQYIQQIWQINIPGLGIFTMLILITLLGFIGSTIIARPFKYLFNKIIYRTPFIKLIYSSLNDLLKAFVGKDNKFNQPVIFQPLQHSKYEKLGFLTSSSLSNMQLEGKVAVYCPHSYNFSGELFIVPKDQIRKLNIPPSEMMKFIVSGGISHQHESH
ncbi:MAG: DUF502 domain-containing protein [Bacteroidota bacterium]